MTDTVSQTERSRIMAQVKSKGNASTEAKIASLFRANKVTGWRRHLPLPGKPDFAFPKAKLAVFLDGCFWHGCPNCYRAPKSSKAYWKDKLSRNKARDKRVTEELEEKGWRVMRFWECELKDGDRIITGIRELTDSECV
ncbi:MAG: very short patch repair endonuclease [Acidobacteria bacterium]|nr:MAG: very short patch repair endonuclease [Acidobacteriota bacterium]REJ98017.1 MAG: very short patch repair endonuclease [Acidobacteriota bacterium]REK16760.1 MAG: very short patch repair endonuclease [Acidobacteriota bacterium]REK42671.1 MAG: very short patch repair endonuclease [Acidobacteriota bacterium]